MFIATRQRNPLYEATRDRNCVNELYHAKEDEGRQIKKREWKAICEHGMLAKSREVDLETVWSMGVCRDAVGVFDMTASILTYAKLSLHQSRIPTR